MKNLISTPFAVVLAASTLCAADPAEELSPTQAEVSYGQHGMNVLDFWQAEGDGRDRCWSISTVVVGLLATRNSRRRGFAPS